MRAYIGHVAGQDRLGNLRLIRIHTPELVSRLHPGHFVLARLLPTWDPYLRVPLFPALIGHATWHASLPATSSFAMDLLAEMPAGTPIRLWGPYGTPFPSMKEARNVVVVTRQQEMSYILALLQQWSRQGEVVLLAERSDTGGLPDELVWIPPAVEIQWSPAIPQALETRLAPLLSWADVLFFCGPPHWPQYFAHWLQERRLTWSPGYAYALVPESITCGLGLCDDCVLETERGHVRLCRKGPVLDLAEWFTLRRRGRHK